MAKFLDKDGLIYLVERLPGMTERIIGTKIITSVGEDSTNQEIPGAGAVYDLLQAAIAGMAHVSLDVVTELPATGEPNVIYLVRQGSSNVYNQSIYINDAWFDLGTTEISLSGYWLKDDLEALSNTEIQDIIDGVFN